MRKKIHPEYSIITASCACGNSFQVGSTMKKDFKMDICNACHPFFTGKQKFVDTEGRVDKFMKRLEKAKKK